MDDIRCGLPSIIAHSDGSMPSFRSIAPLPLGREALPEAAASLKLRRATPTPADGGEFPQLISRSLIAACRERRR